MIFDGPSTYADGHAFAIPANSGAEPGSAKRDAGLEVIPWISDNSLFWATAGHIPANAAVNAPDDDQMMEPNATCSTLTANMIFDPKSEFAGVAGPMFDVKSTDFVQTLNGEMDPAGAVAEIRYVLNDM